MEVIVKPGQWRNAGRVIYERVPDGGYPDDKEIGWAGGPEEAEKICQAHNVVLEKLNQGKK